MKTGLLTVKKTFNKQNNLNKVINIITDLHSMSSKPLDDTTGNSFSLWITTIIYSFILDYMSFIKMFVGVYPLAR